MLRALPLAVAALFLAAPAAAFTVYVTNEKGNTVTIIDSETWEVTGTIEGGQRPRGITISPDGKHLYVCASDDDTVRVFDTATLEQLHT
ncbi:MAG: beta-propeller fold lactonase family protein, partial [Pseudomonadota bacterium]